jgi:hypothetical protein
MCNLDSRGGCQVGAGGFESDRCTKEDAPVGDIPILTIAVCVRNTKYLPGCCQVDRYSIHSIKEATTLRITSPVEII